MKTFAFYEGEYTVSNCKAIPISIGEDEPQDAVYVAHRSEGFPGLYEAIYFGWEEPETDEDFLDMLKSEDWPSWEYEDLETVVFPDGKTPKDYNF